MEQRVIDIKNKFHYEKLSDEEWAVIEAVNCECYQCGDNLIDKYDAPSTRDNHAYCNDCYSEQFYDTCPICQDYYEKITSPEKHFFIVSKEASSEAGVKAGIYKSKDWPIFRASMIGDGFFMFEENIELIKSLDINNVLKHTQGSPNTIGADTICPTCVERYATNGYKRPYYNGIHGIHMAITERGLIKDNRA